MSVKKEPEDKQAAEEKPAVKKTERKPPAWKPKPHDVVNSGRVGQQQYKVGDKVTPENQGQEDRLRKYRIIL